MVTPEAPPRAYEQHIASAPLAGAWHLCCVRTSRVQGTQVGGISGDSKTLARQRDVGPHGPVSGNSP